MKLMNNGNQSVAMVYFLVFCKSALDKINLDFYIYPKDTYFRKIKPINFHKFSY